MVNRQEQHESGRRERDDAHRGGPHAARREHAKDHHGKDKPKSVSKLESAKAELREIRDAMKAGKDMSREEVKALQERAAKLGALVSGADELADGDAALELAETYVPEGASALVSHAKNMAKGDWLNAESLAKIAEKHAPKGAGELVREAEKFAKSDGAIDLAQVARMAGAVDIGLGEKGQALLKQFGDHVGEGLDVEKAQKVPGLIVDKETGKISVFGLLELDPSNPQSRMIAQGLVFANNFLLMPLNDRLFEHSYRGGSKLATTLGGVDLHELSRHRIGLAAALGATALTSFWPNISSAIQMEKNHTKSTAQLANSLAPLLDDYTGEHGVSALYRVSDAQNEVITNARRRLGVFNNADRIREAVQLFSQAPLYGFAVRNGLMGVNAGLRAEVQRDLRNEQAASGQPSAEVEYWQQVNEKADLIHKNTNGKVSPERAVEMAREEMDGIRQTAAANGKPADGMMDYLQKGGVLLAGPVVSSIAQGMYQKQVKALPPISALEMIQTLRRQLDDDPKAASFKLPEGMRLEGRAGETRLPLEEYVAQIFQQHEQDSHGLEARIPSRLSDSLRKVVTQIAGPLREGKLDGMALVKLVGERKMVRPGAKSIASADIVEHELQRLEHEMRRTEWIDDKAYFAEAAFSPEQLTQAWSAMNGDERALFAGLVPAPVLESIGVDAKEIKAMRDARFERLHQDIAEVVKTLAAMDKTQLEQLGATNHEIEQFRQANKMIERKGAESIAPMLKGTANEHGLDRAIVNSVVARYAQHEGRLEELVEQHR